MTALTQRWNTFFFNVKKFSWHESELHLAFWKGAEEMFHHCYLGCHVNHEGCLGKKNIKYLQEQRKLYFFPPCLQSHSGLSLTNNAQYCLEFKSQCMDSLQLPVEEQRAEMSLGY